MNLYIDCDDVLLNWQAGFRRWLNLHHQIWPALTGPQDWNLDSWIGQQSLPFIEQFNNSQSFGYLMPVLGAREFLQHWNDVIVLTACSADPRVIERRNRNLSRHFPGMIDRVQCVPLGSSKRSWLSLWEPGVWVEDNYKNALDGAEMGHQAWVIRRPYNVEFEKSAPSEIKWVDYLSQILSHYK
jgi:hypothetical protein